MLVLVVCDLSDACAVLFDFSLLIVLFGDFSLFLLLLVCCGVSLFVLLYDC